MTDESTPARSTLRRVPKNIILPEKVVDEFRRKLDGLIVDNDILEQKIDGILAAKMASDEELASAVRWNVIRDVIMTLLLVLILALISFNTSQLWRW